MNPYILGPVFGAVFGALFGWLMNTRSVIGTANWIPTYVVMGILSGLLGASKLGNEKKEDREKGELLTETRDYRKKLRKRERDNKKQEE